MKKLGLRILPLLVLLFWTLCADAQTISPSALGAVATQHPLATKAAARVLKQGGNAFDASIAAALTLGVVEPYNSGLGGGGLALLWDGKARKASALDFRETAPKGASPKMYQKAGLPRDVSQVGPLAIAVPSELAGLQALHQKWGRLPWKELFPEAIKFAKDGFHADPVLLAKTLKRKACLSRDYFTWKTYRPLFQTPSDLTRSEEEEEIPPEPKLILWKQENLAKTLEKIRDQGAEVFYTGEVAYRMVSNLKGKGALLRMADLRDYQVKNRLPLSSQFSWGEVWGFPLPTSGGISVLRGLNTLLALEKKTGHKNPWLNWMVEVSNQIFATRNEKMGDGDFVKNQAVKKWISKSFAKNQAGKILSGEKPIAKSTAPAPKGNTTHLSVMDREGNAIAMTLTLNLPFGSCVTAGNTGILMNDEMDDFSTHPGKANAFGLVQSEANGIQAGKRPLSSMSPTLVTQKGKAVLALGSPGGPTIITTVLQVLYRHFVVGQNLAQAIGAPRVHAQGIPKKIFVEPSLGESSRAKLKKLKLPLQSRNPWGNVEAVAFDPSTGRFSAESDPRGIGKSLIANP